MTLETLDSDTTGEIAKLLGQILRAQKRKLYEL
jgi:hypothetical protein